MLSINTTNNLTPFGQTGLKGFENEDGVVSETIQFPCENEQREDDWKSESIITREQEQIE